MDQSYSKSQINRLGKQLPTLIKGTPEYSEAIEILNLWRKDHGPAMDFYFEKAKDIVYNSAINENFIVAARLKRMPTIIDKTKRFPKMNLSQMQDVGGVRIIVHDIHDLEKIEPKIQTLVGLKSSKDYIKTPKPTGYRGKHFIFNYNGTLIEIQLRTYLQHLWATSVETVDTFRGTSLKTSATNDAWEEFFKLVSSCFAHIEKKSPLLEHRQISPYSLSERISDLLSNKIDLALKSYIDAAKLKKGLGDKNDVKYILVSLNTNNKVTISDYFKSFDEAANRYSVKEGDESDSNVLISLDSVNKIQQAYPNYFINLQKFYDWIKTFIAIYREKI